MKSTKRLEIYETRLNLATMYIEMKNFDEAKILIKEIIDNVEDESVVNKAKDLLKLSMKIKRYVAGVEYFGTKYKGWKIQKSTDDTIQSRVDEALQNSQFRDQINLCR